MCDCSLTLLHVRAVARAAPHALGECSQEAGGTRYGTVKKMRFDSAMRVAFHHFKFTEQMMADIIAWYGVGQDDLVSGGKDMVAWRDFTNDVLMALPPTKEQANQLADDNYMEIALAFDCVQGGFDDLPPRLKQVMRELKAMSKREGLGVEQSFKDSCRAREVRLGVLPTDKFLSTIRILFHHYTFSKEVLAMIGSHYGYGDPMVGALGGKEMISWRDFLNDMLVADDDGVEDPKRLYTVDADGGVVNRGQA